MTTRGLLCSLLTHLATALYLGFRLVGSLWCSNTLHLQLKVCWDYLSGTDSYDKIMADIDSHTAISHALAQSIITKVMAMVLNAEDKWLTTAVCKMDLVEPTVKASSQANTN